ncbi:MAG: hypothetical protein O3B86_17900, partial [Planctomycetota bacterium]|nr:hypothetical protein [Planctomycetota bacterium]
MRKLFWCLTALGVLMLALTAGVAQDQAPSDTYSLPNQPSNSLSRLNFLSRGSGDAAAVEESPARSDNSGAILRYQRTRSTDQQEEPQPSATGLQNYHRELFGTAPPPIGSSAKSPSRELLATPRPPSIRPGSVSNGIDRSTDTAVRQAGATQAAVRNTGILPSGGFVTEPSRSGVVQADYAQGNAAGQPILQTSGSTGAPLLPTEVSTEPLELDAPIFEREPVAARQPVLRQDRAPQTGAASSPGQVAGFVNFTQNSPHIESRWTRQSDINVGQPCDLLLTVSNSGQASASEVVVEAYFPRSVRLTAASPKPVSAETSVAWTFPTLDAGEEREIHVTLIPSQRGELTANANVRYSSAATMLLAVEEPLLKLVMQGPEQVMVGESASHVVTVSNPGTGVAHGVILEVNIPEGLEHPKGKRLKMDLGSLNPGEQRSVRLSLTALIGGSQKVSVEATSGTELRQSASAAISVLAPSLKLAVDGPALRYVGRDARYSLTVANDGQAVTNNVRAIYVVPEGFEYLFASRGGKYDSTNRTVSWFIGSVSPNESIELSLKLKPIALGDFAHVARAISEHGAVAEAKVDT